MSYSDDKNDKEIAIGETEEEEDIDIGEGDLNDPLVDDDLVGTDDDPFDSEFAGTDDSEY